MEATRRRSQRASKDGEGTKAKVTKSCSRQPEEKPALSTIEEETDSPDSSGDSAINFRGIELLEASAKNHPYDLRVSLREDCEEVPRDPRDEEGAEKEEEEGKQLAESPPFLTARNGSDHEAGSKSADSNSNSTTSYEKSSPDDDDDDEEEADEDVSSFPGESSSGDADYRRTNDDEVDDLGGDLEEVAERQQESSKRTSESRPKSAPSAAVADSQVSNREERLRELAASVDWLRARLVKSERDVRGLKRQLSLEKSRNRRFALSYEEDRAVTRESLRIDLELWIKKLNEGLKGFLAEWQQRERLRLNEEISRISDLYSQEIARSLRTSVKEWQTEDAKKLLELIDRRDRARRDGERAVHERIHSHLENLEKRNRKSYASFRKQIDKWEDRLRDEVVKLREEDLKKLRQQIDLWHEEERKRSPAAKKTKSKDRCAEKEGCPSFPGSEALLHVEENLLKRLRDSSSKDLRRTEQIVRTELKAQRRELAKRMNEKIAELWMAFEEFGFAPGADRARPRRPASAAVGRNDLEDCRAIAGSFTKDAMLNPDVFGGRRAGGKIAVRDGRADDSTRGSSDVEDGDRDYKEDEDDDDDEEDKSEKSNCQRSPTKVPSVLLDPSSTKNPPTPEATGDTFDAAEGQSRETATKK